jgi:serine/threonine protein kinase
MNKNNIEERNEKPTLLFLESKNNNEDDFFTSVPSRPKKDEYRMTSNILIKDEFKELIHGPTDIIKLYNNAIKIKKLGSGATSDGEIIKLANSDKLYIIKRTNLNEETHNPTKIMSKIKNQLINEQLIYDILERDPANKNYISYLLYADIPLTIHHTPEYNYSYFIFEYKEGVTLDEFINTLIKNNMTLTYEEIMVLISKLAEALRFIHRNGIIHRDLKPANIFIDFTRNNLPLLFDFDISCRIGVDCKNVEFIGTEKYATNSAKKIRRKDNIMTFNSYTYSENYDMYAIVRIMEEDLIKIIRPEDVQKLNEQIELLSPLKLLGGNKMKLIKRVKIKRVKINKTKKAKTIIGGANCKIGVLFPRFGGKRKTKRKGGACPCQAVPKLPIALGQEGYRGGYKATKRNLKYLRKWKRGESIGFTMKSSLKAKGLIARSNGTKRVSPKYQ